MSKQTGSKISSRIMAGVVAIGLGAALLTGAGAASADAGDPNAPCVFNGTSYPAGTRLTVGDTSDICVNGAWTPALERVPSDPPAYTPPTELTPITTLKQEYHPTQRTNSSFLQTTIVAKPSHHWPF